MPNNKFTTAVRKAKILYKTGRYKTFGDAVKAAYKKVGSVGATKKKYKQTGTSNRRADSQRKAKRPGKRKSTSGRTYTETRKNRSDMPGKLTGASPAALKGALRGQLKGSIDKAVLGKFYAKKKRDKKRYQKIITTKRIELRKFA